MPTIFWSFLNGYILSIQCEWLFEASVHSEAGTALPWSCLTCCLSQWLGPSSVQFFRNRATLMSPRLSNIESCQLMWETNSHSSEIWCDLIVRYHSVFLDVHVRATSSGIPGRRCNHHILAIQDHEARLHSGWVFSDNVAQVLSKLYRPKRTTCPIIFFAEPNIDGSLLVVLSVYFWAANFLIFAASF